MVMNSKCKNQNLQEKPLTCVYEVVVRMQILWMKEREKIVLRGNQEKLQ